MTVSTEDLLNSILESISRIDYIKPEDIPNIDLYMDQVTTFMERQLKQSKRHEEDKILTKTMINNYAKNHLLPPPEKKKYSNEHLLVLIFIYYFKNLLSISDIQTLLAPITEQFFQVGKEFSLKDIYEEVFKLEKTQVDLLKESISLDYMRSRETFEDAPEDKKEYLKLFSFLCMLSFDVYVKKQIIEKVIDQIAEIDLGEKEGKGKKKEKESK